MNIFRRMINKFKQKLLYYYIFSVMKSRKHPEMQDVNQLTNRLMLIQVDGLSDRVLTEALATGKLPFLKKLIDNKLMRRHRYSPGVPSTTATFNAGLVYGAPEAIPGFMWFDKQNNKNMFMGVMEDAAIAETKLLTLEKESLFKDGACYCSVFGGGARKAIFTASRTSSPVKRFKGIWWQFLIFGLVNTYQSIKLFFIVIGRALVLAFNLLGRKIKGFSMEHEWHYFLMRLLVEKVFRRVMTVNATLDIMEGVPVIYLDYFGYDENAHRRGPYSRVAMRNLLEIDRHIEILFEALRMVPFYNYWVYIFSDHGQTPTTSYKNWKKLTLREDILSNYLKIDSAIKLKDRYNLILKHQRVAQIYNYLKFTSPPVEKLLSWYFRITLERARKYNVKDENFFNALNIVVIEGGPYAHIYFKDIKGKADLRDIQKHYPGFIEFLQSNSAIGFMILWEKGTPYVYRNGERFSIKWINKDKLGLSFTELTEKQVKDYFMRWANLKEGGDIVVLGNYTTHGNLTFVQEEGSHGGLEDHEIHGFILSPPRDLFDFSEIYKVEDLHHHLMEIKNQFRD